MKADGRISGDVQRPSRRGVRRAGAGALLALVVFSLYVTAWRPARAWLGRTIVYPLVVEAATKSAPLASACIDLRKKGLVVEVPASNQCGLDPFRYNMPGGILLLLGSTLLAGLFPFRKGWIHLWVLHIVYGAVCLALLLIMLLSGARFLEVYGFVEGYGTQVLGLLSPMIILGIYGAIPGLTEFFGSRSETVKPVQESEP